MLSEGMQSKGHSVSIWKPEPVLSNYSSLGGPKKWLGYFDQYIAFPRTVRQRLQSCPPDTLFVFTDHALGPWVPLVANRPHVIHCHDFLAQYSAKNKIAENRTGTTGKIYQSYIRRGYSMGRNFISVSHKTKADLHYFLEREPALSEVVYNGVNPLYHPFSFVEAREKLGVRAKLNVLSGYLLHVGGNQWYKNREGVIELYNTWRREYNGDLPLLLIGEPPSKDLMKLHEESPFREDIHFISGLEDEYLVYAYAGASLFLFPSLAEGFGWPIVEAMACGCPVITTGEDPMKEVGGKAAWYIGRRTEDNASEWASDSSAIVNRVLAVSGANREQVATAGFENVKRFGYENTMQRIEQLYEQILKSQLI